jgi:hypothetical protein
MTTRTCLLLAAAAWAAAASPAAATDTAPSKAPGRTTAAPVIQAPVTSTVEWPPDRDKAAEAVKGRPSPKKAAAPAHDKSAPAGTAHEASPATGGRPAAQPTLNDVVKRIDQILAEHAGSPQTAPKKRPPSATRRGGAATAAAGPAPAPRPPDVALRWSDYPGGGRTPADVQLSWDASLDPRRRHRPMRPGVRLDWPESR